MKTHLKFLSVLIFFFTGHFALAQTAPGGIGNSDGSDGQPEIKLWLLPDSLSLSEGNDVLLWTDYSGNNQDLSAVALTSPIFRANALNGHDFLEFSKSNNRIVANPYDMSTTAITVFMVLKTADSGDALLSYAVTGQDNEYLFYQSNALTTYISGSNSNSGVGYNDDTWKMFAHQWRSSDGRLLLHIDGTEQENTNFQSGTTLSTGGCIAIGGEQDGVNSGYSAGQDFDGDIAEIIMYGSSMLQAQRVVIENYLAQKYALDANLPVDRFIPDDASYIVSMTGMGKESDGTIESSSDGLIITQNGGFDNGEYIFSAHDGSSNLEADINRTSEVTNSGAAAAWNRNWYIDKSGGVDAKIAFDFSAGIGGQNPGVLANYVLLYRADLVSDYSYATVDSKGIQNGDQIYFAVSDANLSDGYYTLGTTDETDSPLTGIAAKNWYTLISGNWEDWEVWTLDPSGALPNNPGHDIPAVSDNVYILTGKTVTVNTNSLSNPILSVEGRFDFQTTTGHSFGEIKGNGRILLAADEFPGGDASHFYTAGQGEGTVEYYGTSFNLNQSLEFYNLVINMDGVAQILTLLNNYTINNYLRIEQGVFQINDNSSTTALTIDITGDITVLANGSITTGTGNARHQLNSYGDFTNSGSVAFTNRVAANYGSEANDGIVDFNALNNTANQTIQCKNTTIFYRIEIDKGTDDTYELSVEADNSAYFSLFGYAAESHASVAQLTDNNNALGLVKGTVRIKTNVNIPVLNNTGNYNISEAARLWVDGGTVTKSAGTAIVSYSEAKISSGTFESTVSGGFILRDNGTVRVEGGTLNTNQIRTSVLGAGNVGGYYQSGGTANLLGGSTNIDYYVFNLTYGGNVFIMTGGTLHIHESHGKGGIFINSDNGNYNVTGGTIICEISDTDDFTITSKAPFWDVILRNSLANSNEIILDEGVDVGSTDVDLAAQPLNVLNDLTIETDAVLNANGFDLKIGYDFDFESGATYTHGGNTTWFHETGNTAQIFVRDISTTNPLVFNNVTIEKDQRYNPLLFRRVQIAGGARVAGNSAVSIEGNLLITRGEFDTDDYTIELAGNIEITDGQIIETGGTGYISLVGSALQTLKAAITKEQSFGHLELNNVNNVQLLSNVNVTDFTLTNGIVNLDIYNVDISGTINGSGFSNTKMFLTSGNVADGGMTRYIDLSLGVADTETLYPMGTGTIYTPVTVIQSATIADAGQMTINPVANFHPATSDPTKTIPYYWVVDTTGFASVLYTQLKYTFTYPGSTPPSVNKGSNLWDVDYDWYTHNNVLSGNDIIFPYAAYLTGDYTLGNNSVFNKPTIYYSRVFSGNWNDGNSWSTVGYGLAAAGSIPNSYDIVKIGYHGSPGSYTRHRITLDLGTIATPVEIACLVLEQNPEAGLVETDMSRLIIPPTRGLRVNGKISGDGEVQFQMDGTNIPTFEGDFNNFVNTEGAGFIMQSNNGNVSAPANITCFPNLSIYGNSDDWADTESVVFTADIYCHNLNVRYGGTLLLNTGANGDVEVRDSVRIGGIGTDNQGRIIYQNNGTARTISVGTNLVFDTDGATYTDNRLFAKTGGTDNLEHKLDVYGDIILRDANSLLDIYTSNDGLQSNVILNIYGETNQEYTSTATTTPEFYRIVMNKLESNDFDFLDPLTLNGPTDGDTKALELISGDLTFNDAAIDITLTSGGANFKIPKESSLRASYATLRASGNNTGIWLDGYMNVGYRSNWNINEGTNNYIEYTSSGNSEIAVYQGTLKVGSQIRRSLVADEGILNFRHEHSNSTVIIGTDASIPNNIRSVFEIANTGSLFKQTANSKIIIPNAPSSASVPAVYINLDLIDNPSAATIETGAVIQLGGDETQTNQNLGIYSNIDLGNISVSNSSANNPTAKIRTLPITLTEDLTIDAGATFDANGFQLNIAGDFTNNGNYTANGNTVLFNGSLGQSITGTTDFYNLTKDPNVNTLTLNDDITVNNELKLVTGTLNDGDNTLHAKGNVWMDAAHIWGGTSDGIVFDGTETQVLQTENGTAAFAKLSVNNSGSAGSAAVFVPEGNTISIDDMLQMENGIFDIGKNLIVLSAGASINEKNAFSAYNMIQTNISFTDAGIKKFFPAIAVSTTFIYPIGSVGKYTPVEFTIDAVDAGGYIRVKAADEIHPTIINDDEPCDDITDSLNVLKYHWLLEANGINNFTAAASMTFNPNDIQIDNTLSGTSYDITSYIAARLLLSSSLWNKYDPNSFDEDNDRMTFSFTGTNDDGISGDYTAGIEDQDGTCEGAIPNEVPAYVSISDGNWTNNAIWDTYPTAGGTVPAGGPRGAIVLVEHEVTLPQNYILNYKTTIDTGGVNNGIVKVNNTFGHRLGIVDGIGTLHTFRGTLPAGVYDDFFSTSGGTLEFAGTDDYDVLSEIVSVNNLTFTGTGERRFPNLDLQILGELFINGPDLINEHNEKLSIKGNITFDAGTYNTGFGTEAVIIMNGSSSQTIGGILSFTTTTNDFNNLRINNSAGVTLNKPVDLFDHLTFDNGIIHTDNVNILTLTSTAENIVTDAGTGKFVDGPLNKVMLSAGNFDFPVGNASRYGNIVLSSVNSNGTYQAEYYNYNPGNDGYDPLSFKNPIQVVSDNEYWRVFSSVAGAKASITLRWDAQSGMFSGDLNDMEIALWKSTSQWEQEDPTNVAIGDALSGTITQQKTSTYNEFAGGNIFTLSSVYTPQILTWDGSTSTEWNDGTNWNTDNVPTQLDDINIPNLANDPAISVAANCSAINTLASGATLTINPGASLTVHGDFTNDGDVYILSPSDATAGGSLIDNGVINGTGSFHVERYITGNEYHYVSSPIATGGNANSDLFTNLESGQFNSNFYGYDETIDLDANPATAPAGVFDPYNLVPGWYYAHNGNGGAGVDMEVGKGYSYYNTAGMTVTYTGTVNIGSQDITGLPFTNNDPIAGPLPDYYDGWNLIGNPYPSAVDWDLIDDAIVNVDNAIYVWDGTQYASYVGGITGGSGNQNNEIAPMQAFFVHATGNNASVTLNNSHRIHSTADYLKSGKNEINDQLRLKISANGYEDKTVLYIRDNATNGFDAAYDAYRLFSGYPDVPHIYTMIENGNIPTSVNAVNSDLEEDMIIPIGIKVQTPGTYTVSLDYYETFDNINLYFEDNLENVFIPIEELSDYTFDFTGGTVTDRFALHMNINHAPIIQIPVEPIEIFEDESSDFKINKNTFTDIDLGDEIKRYEAKMASGENLPVWLEFDPINLSFSGLPGNDEVGEYFIKLSAYDKHNAEGSTELLLTVINTNDEPFVQNTIEDQNTNANENYHFTFDENTFVDIDKDDVLTYTAEVVDLTENSDVSWLSFDGDSRTFNGNPLSEDAGEYRIYITAADLFGSSAVTDFKLTVIAASNIEDDILTVEAEVYPNSTIEGFYLKLSKSEGVTIALYDIKGTLVLEKEISDKETYIKVNNLNSGMYFMKINSNGSIINKKLIIK